MSARDNKKNAKITISSSHNHVRKQQRKISVKPSSREPNEANQQLAWERDLLSILFQAHPIPTALIRMDDNSLLNVNAEFLNYFDLERENVIGHKVEEFGLALGLGTNGQMRNEFNTRAKREGKIGRYETQITRAPGEVCNILASVQYIRIENTDALITAFVDITERVRAEQQIRQLASELNSTEQAERHRLAQILHDDLQQRIFAIQMQMSFLKDAYEKNDLHTFAVDFPQLEEWLAEAIKVTRQLSVDLSPPILHGEGLLEATNWLASQMEDQYGLKVKIKSDGKSILLDEKIRLLAFHAIRELLFNVVKHAGTSEATVRFEQDDSQLLVTVSDLGSGFDSTRVMSSSIRAHGLLILRHRLSLLGCGMQINSQPGKGTEVIIDVPYEKMDVSL